MLLALLAAGPARAHDARTVTFFQGTQHPLTVVFIHGREPGPTVMVQGGIQGDEAAGYLTAQLLTHSQVRRGNLIVIPRANLPSVHAHRRAVNVDLNRRFDQDYNRFYEDHLARVIRFLLDGADAFIHLHEGSGFYHPTWVDTLRNPRRYGQSIIIDTTVYNGRIHLAQAVDTVLPRLNHAIDPEDWRFKLFNTRTFDTDSQHLEQRKSLTYYALSHRGIPALAIEVSKNISSLGWKVLQQLKAAQLFLEFYGVEVTTPFVTERDIEDYARREAPGIRVNGVPVRPGSSTLLHVAPGARVDVTREGPADASSGGLLGPVPAVMAEDRPEVDLLHTPRLALGPRMTLDLRSDGNQLGTVRLAWDRPAGSARGSAPDVDPDFVLFACWLNGQLRFVPAGGTLEAVVGDQLVLEGIWGESGGQVINFKGYVSQPGRNTGQDIGEEIILDPGQFLSGYVDHDDAGWTCKVVRETPGARRDAMRVRIRSRTVDALRLTGPDGTTAIVPWSDGGRAGLTPGSYVLDGAWSNGPQDKLLATVDSAPLPWGETLDLPPGGQAVLVLRQATTFKPIAAMTLSATP